MTSMSHGHGTPSFVRNESKNERGRADGGRARIRVSSPRIPVWHSRRPRRTTQGSRGQHALAHPTAEGRRAGAGISRG